MGWLSALFGGGSGAGASEGGGGSLCPPEAHPVHVRSTEVMAHVVRIRKAHAGLHRALSESSASVRRLLEASYARLCGFVKTAYDLAGRADKLRAHLDADLAAGGAAGAAARARLDREYAEVTGQLVSVATALEAWHAEVLRMGAGGTDAAEAAARAVADELEKMAHLVRALEEATDR